MKIHLKDEKRENFIESSFLSWLISKSLCFFSTVCVFFLKTIKKFKPPTKNSYHEFFIKDNNKHTYTHTQRIRRKTLEFWIRNTKIWKIMQFFLQLAWMARVEFWNEKRDKSQKEHFVVFPASLTHSPMWWKLISNSCMRQQTTIDVCEDNRDTERSVFVLWIFV